MSGANLETEKLTFQLWRGRLSWSCPPPRLWAVASVIPSARQRLEGQSLTLTLPDHTFAFKCYILVSKPSPLFQHPSPNLTGGTVGHPSFWEWGATGAASGFWGRSFEERFILIRNSRWSQGKLALGKHRQHSRFATMPVLHRNDLCASWCKSKRKYKRVLLKGHARPPPAASVCRHDDFKWIYMKSYHRWHIKCYFLPLGLNCCSRAPLRTGNCLPWRQLRFIFIILRSTCFWLKQVRLQWPGCLMTLPGNLKRQLRVTNCVKVCFKLSLVTIRPHQFILTIFHPAGLWISLSTGSHTGRCHIFSPAL